MKNKLDLTTSWQKSIAVLILLGLGFIVVKFLPIFIMAGVIGLGLIFYRPIWNGLKILFQNILLISEIMLNFWIKEL